MSLQNLLHPASIAIIGASTKVGSVGNDVLKNIIVHGYEGKAYPVNPKADFLYDLPCFATIKDIPEKVDLAIIIVPAQAVISVVTECGEVGVQNIIIISAGFKEVGEEGKAREAALTELVAKYNLTLLGPNCLGFINPHHRLNASFAKQMPDAGSIGFFSQSGALSTALLDMTHESLAFSQFLSVGNKTALTDKDFLAYLNTEPHTSVIGFYSEDITDARSFIATGRALTKPTLVLKSGATDAGSKASSSHTGSLAGSDMAYSALFRQAHILRTETFQEFLDTLLVTSKNSFPAGSHVAILTNAGGLGVLASDAVSKKGLLLAELSPETTAKLQALLPPAASSHNPVDVLGDAPMQRYEDALTVIGSDPSVEMILVIVTPQSMTEAAATAEAILRFRAHSETPLAAVFAGKDSFAEARALLDPTIATYQMPEAAANALAALHTFSLWTNTAEEPALPTPADTNTTVSHIIEQAKNEGKNQLLAIEVESVLANYGFTFPRAVTVTSRADAEENARLFTAPVVLKIISPEIIHKSDAGGVLLNIPPENIGSAYDTLMETITKNVPEAVIKGVSINEQIDSTHGKELILGIKTEPGLGKVIVVGLGGIYVEVFQDASLRFAPLTRSDVTEMLDELKSKALLTGTRGEPPIDLEPLYEALLRLSDLAMNHPEIESLDVNPFLVFPKGKKGLALDARISLL